MKILKRNGVEVDFDKEKIITAIKKANLSVDESKRLSEEAIKKIADVIEKKCKSQNFNTDVEKIQDMVVYAIMSNGAFELAQNYITYRFTHTIKRNRNGTYDKILSLVNLSNERIKQENSNKNPVINSTQRDYIAGEVSKDISMSVLLDQDIIDAHNKGIIHFHDSDYFVQKMHNCDLVNLEDMLNNSTVISGTLIEKPHSFSTACNIATQIIAQVASNQYGGQSITLSHLAPFVDISRKKIHNDVKEELCNTGINKLMTEEEFDKSVDLITDSRLRREVSSGVQTIQYQIETLLTSNGQTPFVTIFMYLNEVPDGQTKDDLALIIEETLKQRIQGVKNEQGVWITPAFPKLIYVVDTSNCEECTKYWYLTELAAKCTAKRMVPDYISEKKMMEFKVDENGEGHCFPAMGCRSLLSPYVDPETGKPKYYGRFNQGVVTIDLPYIACLSNGDETKFWEIFEYYLEMCYRALMVRHNRLKGTVSDVAPILWQYGAISRLKKGETIDKLLYGGYSTISLGYAGLSECTYRMKGVSHTDPDGKDFAIAVMKKLNDKCDEWKAATNIGFSVYGTPKLTHWVA